MRRLSTARHSGLSEGDRPTRPLSLSLSLPHLLLHSKRRQWRRRERERRGRGEWRENKQTVLSCGTYTSFDTRGFLFFVFFLLFLFFPVPTPPHFLLTSSSALSLPPAAVTQFPVPTLLFCWLGADCKYVCPPPAVGPRVLQGLGERGEIRTEKSCKLFCIAQ